MSWSFYFFSYLFNTSFTICLLLLQTRKTPFSDKCERRHTKDTRGKNKNKIYLRKVNKALNQIICRLQAIYGLLFLNCCLFFGTLIICFLVFIKLYTNLQLQASYMSEFCVWFRIKDFIVIPVN